MSDPLLTTLCTICHREPPKYKCPRCGIRTCSLPCTKKHKAWASCSGERDPASFVPRARLVTDAGVDHDYNFISKIERAKELFEKKVVAEKGLLGEGEIRGPKRGQEDKRFEKVWYGDQLVHEPAATRGGGGRWGGRGGRGGQGGGGGGGLDARFDQQVRQRLRRNDIRVLTMPRGLSRQKENKTAWNRRTNTVNWQVEWMLCGIDSTTSEDDKPVRICHKCLDEKPIYQGLAETLEWDRSAAQKRKRAREDGDVEDDEQPLHKKQKPPTRKQRAVQYIEAMTPLQESTFSTWPASEYTMQCTATGQWNQTSSEPSVPRSNEEEAAQLAKLRFFLFKPATPDDPSKGLIPLASTDNLVGVLSGRTIIEFPTLYVLRPDAPLPEGLGLTSTERRSKDSDSDSEEDGKGTNSKKTPMRNGRTFERPVRPGADFDPTNANRAPLGHNRLSGRKERHDDTRPPQKHVQFAVPEEDAEEGELNSEGEEVYNARAAMDMVAASIVADAISFGGDASVDVDAGPETQVAKPVAKGLVDYGSDSD
ncbi:hypothetical protein GE09DRAFT_1246108 [Coniochaeta sp. 2T2.1]|nr:hypothetical protein GE09DRAFT_1246108 [Coniochaeta sp. 2T2.1]